MQNRHRGVILAALFLVLPVAGCSQDPAPQSSSGEVATITGTQAATKPSAAAQRGTMLRIDMTEDEIQQAHQAYTACLKANGVAVGPKGLDREPTAQDKASAPFQACQDKEPYLDPLMDKTKNPRYADQTRAWMKCMNERDIPVSGNWDDEFFTIGDAPAGMDSNEYKEVYRQCQVESYKW
ncbi:hypothetical protein AB0F72_27825 [Actinoplanes sp. NPDC023936]|uniref:hypothetical protein n=1 Tax=Actinoplanes sp. NPDC023936 TaxID=3154910 RepID=UPI0033E59963